MYILYDIYIYISTANPGHVPWSIESIVFLQVTGPQEITQLLSLAARSVPGCVTSLQPGESPVTAWCLTYQPGVNIPGKYMVNDDG